ncbi:hypothetical protein B6D29_04390 [Microgenomates bacterium UTCPR1]|nr:MAG: hypothetical protein B6D29_04390 [Microgenomates bacterium UTCPR1]
MKIIIAYATYSGGTQAACEYLSQVLTSNGHQTTIKMISDTIFEDLLDYDLRIFASPTWDFEGKEGQPHQDFITWMENNKDKKLDGKPSVVLGLGDSSYAHFCGANSIIEEFIKSVGGSIKAPALEVDAYLFNMEENNKKISDWTNTFTP